MMNELLFFTLVVAMSWMRYILQRGMRDIGGIVVWVVTFKVGVVMEIISNIHDFKPNSISFFIHWLCLNESESKRGKGEKLGKRKERWARRVGILVFDKLYVFLNIQENYTCFFLWGIKIIYLFIYFKY